jgi:microcystin degradation protein MlrC
MTRVLVGAFSLEANSFARGSTTRADFPIWVEGEALTPEALGPDSELAAAWAVLRERGIAVVPGLAAWCAPRQPLDGAAVDAIVEGILAGCDDGVDGAYLMLHGAAVAHGEPDPEGRLLTALRARLGPGRPIAISLDCHAHLTPAMVAAVDVVAAYRTCPHVDTARTGAQAARLLADALDGSARPFVAMAARPMITPPQLHDDRYEPFRSLMARCDALEREPGLLAAALLPVQPWIDVPGLSWKAVVTADGDRALAQAAAQRLIDAAWERRERFLPEPAPVVDDALAQARAAEPPVVLADTGDATNGGTVGDSTELLRAVLRRPDGGRVLLSVTDAAAAAGAHAAGIGARLAVGLGHGEPGSYNERVELDAAIVALSDGRFAYTHPVSAGYRAEAGPAALLRSGPLDVVVHTRPVGVIDPAVYRALGADPSEYQVVQAKSHVSYRAGFAEVTPRSVVAATDGPSTAELERLDYRHRPRPLFPFER